MIEVIEDPKFTDWLSRLRDRQAKAKIAGRIQRLAHGLAGDVQAVGDGVSELRIHFGPGYRVYFMLRGATLVILLVGGDKSSQERDIKVPKCWPRIGNRSPHDRPSQVRSRQLSRR